MKHPASLLGRLSLFWVFAAPLRGHAVASAPASPADTANLKSFIALQKRLTGVDKQDPTKAIEAYQQFEASHPTLSPATHILVAGAIAAVYEDDLKDPRKALDTLDTALNNYDNDPASIRLVADKAHLLTLTGRTADAQRLMGDFWYRIAQADPQQAAAIGADGSSPLGLYFDSLEQQGRQDELQHDLQKILSEAPAFLDDQGDWIYAKLNDVLLHQKRFDEAQQWAKQRFSLCTYERNAVARAANMWALAVRSHDPEQNSQKFVLFQKEAAHPDPFAAVGLPAAQSPGLINLVQAYQQRPGQKHQLISLYLLHQAFGEAMTEAMQALADNPQSPQGAQEVGRVFKAADDNLLRANAFLDFFKTGQGPSPLEDFLKEHTPANSAAKARAASLVLAVAKLSGHGGVIPEKVGAGIVTLAFLTGELRTGALTPENALALGGITADDLRWELDNVWLAQKTYIALAGLLVKQAPESIQPPTVLGPRLKQALAEYYRSVHDARAVPLLEELLASIKEPSPNEGEPLLHLLATHYVETGDLPKAIDLYLHADRYSTAPEYIASHLMHAARLYRRLGDNAKADELVAKIPAYGFAWVTGMARYEQAQELIKQGQHEAARKLLLMPVTGLYADQIQVGLSSLLARSYYGTGDLEAARKYSEAATAQYQTIIHPLQGEGLEQQVSKAQSLQKWIHYWSQWPFLCDPGKIQVVAGGPTPGEKPQVCHVKIRSYHEIPLAIAPVGADNSQDKAALIIHLEPQWHHQEEFVERDLEVAVPAPVVERLNQGLAASLVVTSSQHPGFEVRVPLQLKPLPDKTGKP
ncbi:MAG: hypothetical protein JOZ57_12070 [Abitibacteriaceae bacterium]|nr:hypothetical protein [Abditibacteriaceae bacterium]